MKLDLHVHSNFSDGDFNVEELIKLYSKTGLNGFALTDHDNVDGLIYLDRANLDTSLKIIPGIEFSCNFLGNDVHILGLNIDYKNKNLYNKTKKLKKSRELRAKKIVKLLKQEGIYLNETEIFRNKTVGRPHIAIELIDKGYAHTMEEAFSIYLNKGSKYFVPKENLTIEEAIDLIKIANGKAVLAHPGKTKNLDKVLKSVKKLGIDGIEVIHPSNNKKMTKNMIEFCEENNYIQTGGSDFHRRIEDIGVYYVEC